LTATAEEFFGWRANSRLLHHFDALPTRLIPRYGTSGIRPDLLFNLGDGGGLAGEAKGRSRKPPTKVLAEQVKYMNKLLDDAGDTDDPMRAVQSVPSLSRYLGSGDDVPDTADRSPERLAIEAMRRAVAMESALYREAAQLEASDQTVRHTLLGRSVVGSWVPLDLFAGTQRPRRLFFGLLDGELTASEVEDLWVDRGSRSADDGKLDVDVTSRMVVAITKRASASPPSWEEVHETLRRG
jgi:hypothetical protein